MKFVVVFIALISSRLFSQNLPIEKEHRRSNLIYKVNQNYEVEGYLRFRVSHYLYKNYKHVNCQIVEQTYQWLLQLYKKIESGNYPDENYLEMICKNDPSFCPYYQESKNYWKAHDSAQIKTDHGTLKGASLLNPNLHPRYTEFHIESIRNNPIFEDIYIGRDDIASLIDKREAHEFCFDYIELLPLFKMKDATTVIAYNFIEQAKIMMGDEVLEGKRTVTLPPKIQNYCNEFKYLDEVDYPQSIHEKLLFCAKMQNVEPDILLQKFCSGATPFLCSYKDVVTKLYRLSRDEEKTQNFIPSALCPGMSSMHLLCH